MLVGFGLGSYCGIINQLGQRRRSDYNVIALGAKGYSSFKLSKYYTILTSF